MTDTLKELALAYANPQNILLAGTALIAILLLVRLITALCGLRDFKRINRILRSENGDEIIRRIEALHLSRRFDEMWEDYYEAFCAEDTVTLSEYLIFSDKSVPTHFCRNLARAVAALTLTASIASVAFVPGLREDMGAFWCCAAALLTVLLFAEASFSLIEAVRARRLRRRMEEFRQLSLRKLPGKAVDFSGRYLLQALEQTMGEVRKVQDALTQVNARLDRQYRTLVTMKQEKTEEKDT